MKPGARPDGLPLTLEWVHADCERQVLRLEVLIAQLQDDVRDLGIRIQDLKMPQVPP